MKKNTKKPIQVLFRILFALIIFIGAGFCCYKVFFDPFYKSVNIFQESLSLETVITPKQAIDDLNYVYDKIKTKHPLWLEKDQTEKLFEVQRIYASELAKFRSIESVYKRNAEFQNSTKEQTEITICDLWQSISRMLHPIYDGHTSCYPTGNTNYINDFSTINKQIENLIAINDISIEELETQFLSMYSYELEHYAKNSFLNSLVLEQYLQLIGIDTSKPVSYTYNDNGRIFTEKYSFVPWNQVTGIDKTNTNEENVVASYTIDRENSVGIFKLNYCENSEEYRTILANFFDEVFAEEDKDLTNIDDSTTTSNLIADKETFHKAEIKNVVVDLRNNGGGNSTVANEFIRYLPVDTYKGWDSYVRYGDYLLKNKDIIETNNKYQKTFNGNLYVLTNFRSYSSAMDFAMYIVDNNLGTLVGETSGNKPNSYGDCLYFNLPNSKLGLSVSFKKWFRIDKTKNDEPLTPDYETTSSEALNKVYELIKNSLSYTKEQ